MDAYCPHMGANLSFGKVKYDNCIQCPFHVILLKITNLNNYFCPL